MSGTVRCNVCFTQARSRDISKFVLTNCGHVLCETCLMKGKKEECTVCRAHCRIVFLSGQLSPDVQAFFMDVNVLCKKYSKEFTQISEFQESHRRRCLAFYKEKITKLEETIKKLTKQVEQLQLQSFRSPQPTSVVQSSNAVTSSYSRNSAKHNGYSSYSLHSTCPVSSENARTPQPVSRLPPSSTAKNQSSGHSTKHNGYSSYSLPLSRPSSSEFVDTMDVEVSSQFKKPETVTGPNRISLISPPHDGRMGCVSHRNSHPSGLSASQYSFPGSVRLTPVRISQQTNVYGDVASFGSQSSIHRLPEAASVRTPQLSQQMPSSSQPPSARHQISISSLLQRHNLGQSSFRGHTTLDR